MNLVEPAGLRPSFAVPGPWRVAALAAAALVVLVAAIAFGGFRLDWHALFEANAPSLPFDVLTRIRLPRVLLAATIGAGLALGGVALQAIFRNPLADPGLLGIATGAAVAAGLAIVVVAPRASVTGPWFVPLCAFGGALLVCRLALGVAGRAGGYDVALLLLVGIAINAIGGAALGFLLFVADDTALRDFTFWTLGSLAGASWQTVLPVLVAAVLAATVFFGAARPLNAFVLGERDAFYLGVDVERAKRRLVLGTSLWVGASVAVSGLIGFVGLVVPHIARFIVGPNHRLLLPAAALLGATLLMGADLIARTAVLPAELPVGIVTAALGAPAFLWLTLRHFRAAIRA